LAGTTTRGAVKFILCQDRLHFHDDVERLCRSPTKATSPHVFSVAIGSGPLLDLAS
jgi:hypothetical protein